MDVGIKKKKREQNKQVTVEEICGEVDYVNMDEGRIQKEHSNITRHDEKDCLFVKMDKEERIPVDYDKLVKIVDLPLWAQKSFAGLEYLNTLQSRVFEAAFNKDENMLICAPTGAGKTNVAMLTCL